MSIASVITIFSLFNYFNSKKIWLLSCFAFVFPLFLYCFRSYSQPDFENYVLIYEGIAKSGSAWRYLTSIEPLFLVLMKFFIFLGFEYEDLSNFILFVICLTLTVSALKYTDEVRGGFVLAFLFFSSYYFPFLSLNVVRQGLAVSFFALGLSYYSKDSRFYYFYFLLAFLMHYSALLVVVSLFFSSFLMKRFDYRFFGALILVCMVVGFFDVFSLLPLPELVSVRVEKLKNYGGSGVTSLIKLLLYILFFLSYSVVAFYLKRVNRRVFCACATYLCFALVFLRYGELLDRIIMYSLVFGAFLIFSLYKLLRPRLLAYMVVFSYSCLSFLLVMLSPSTKGFLQ